jgi:hypothetical protein
LLPALDQTSESFEGADHCLRHRVLERSLTDVQDFFAIVDLFSERTSRRFHWPESICARNSAVMRLNKSGLLEIHRMAGGSNNREPRRRTNAFHEYARLEAVVVLIAADNMQRNSEL